MLLESEHILNTSFFLEETKYDKLMALIPSTQVIMYKCGLIACGYFIVHPAHDSGLSFATSSFASTFTTSVCEAFASTHA